MFSNPHIRPFARAKQFGRAEKCLNLSLKFCLAAFTSRRRVNLQLSVSARVFGKATSICLVVENIRVNNVYGNVYRLDFLLFREYNKFFGSLLNQHLVTPEKFYLVFSQFFKFSFILFQEVCL